MQTYIQNIVTLSNWRMLKVANGRDHFSVGGNIRTGENLVQCRGFQEGTPEVGYVCVQVEKKNTVGIVILYLEIKKYDWSTLQIQGLKFLTSENIQIIVINTEGTYQISGSVGVRFSCLSKKQRKVFKVWETWCN